MTGSTAACKPIKQDKERKITMANKNAKPKNPRTRAIVSLVAILVVVAVCGYVALFGIGKGTMVNYLKPWGEAISLGLDLRGGVYTVYAAEDDGSEEFETKMSSTVSILTSRLTRQGFTEATVTRPRGDSERLRSQRDPAHHRHPGAAVLRG